MYKRQLFSFNEIRSKVSSSFTSLILNFSICFSNLISSRNFLWTSACSSLKSACSCLKNFLRSLALSICNCFSSFNSVFLSSTCFFNKSILAFSSALFCCLSLSTSRILNFCFSSIINFLVSIIFFSIKSKKPWIFFSGLSLILKRSLLFILSVSYTHLTLPTKA